MKNKINITNKIKIVIAVIILLLLLLTILIVNRGKLSKTEKIANNEYNVLINETAIDISNVTTTEPNPPVIGAGMIPVKWNEESGAWEITRKEDPEWYNYSTGKLANVMLSDGYYKSELEIGIDSEKQLANKKVGEILGDPEKVGSIFTWVPRLMYKQTEDGTIVEYLKNTCMVEQEWTTPSCFTHYKLGINEADLAFTGMWVSNKTTQSINNTEENKYGLIKNEIVSGITSEELTVVQKLNQKLGGNTSLVEANPIQTIKILNTNMFAKITTQHKILPDGIEFRIIHNENNISMVLDKNGNSLSLDAEKKVKIEIDEDSDEYIFYVVDTEKNIRKHSFKYTSPGRPNLSGFNLNTTFYVTYDEAGNEESIIPIGEKKPTSGWYDYDNQMWANVVTRNNGDEAYFVWIPRYMYKLNTETQRADVKFVDTSNNYTDIETGKVYNPSSQGYILPEAFTWSNRDLKGYWISKYELGDTSNYKPEITGGSGVIRVKNILANLGTTNKYEMYLIQNGKRIIFNSETGKYEEGTTPIILTSNNYTFTGLEKGNYAVEIVVKDATTNKITKVLNNEVTVLEPTVVEVPNLDGFDKNHTFYVTYDANGNETSVVPIGEEAPSNWYNYDNQQWANIVTRNNGQEAYFVWIPRYEYKLDTANQRSSAIFIPKTKTTADSGYTIPEAFTWSGRNLAGYWISKYELGDTSTPTMTATVAGDTDSIVVSNVVDKISSGATTFEAYVIKDGKIVSGPNVISGKCMFSGLEPGNYTVHVIGKNAKGSQVLGLTKEVVLQELETPNVTGFNVDTTYIVTYDSSGNEDTSQTLRSVLKDGANISSNGALTSGSVDLSKIAEGRTWYKYSNQMWPNIVTRNADQEAYFVWIPRYEYKLNTIAQRSEVILIPKDKTSPDSGYTIPEAFTWSGRNLAGYWISKYELGVK